MSNIPLSWSRISVYRQCPSQFEAKYLTKTYPDEGDNPAFIKGTEVHKQLENYINWKKTAKKEPSLGKIAINVKPIIDSYFNRIPKDAISAEKQLALNHEWKECGWFDSTKIVKWRGILDMLVISAKDKLVLIDFKTGKVRPYVDDRGQLHLSAAMLFELYPDIQRITSAYLFAEHKETNQVVFKRDDHAKNKAAFDVEWLQINEDKEFEPKKNQYCYFCGIKEDCIYG